ncbi:hypothetical protein ACFVMC_29960 [Nocardia sp. NPDC127579]|uniref:hypothetical protein n=1 Tax=Nocardia sp. NPDC127579 TaxID=3345402 RepID=UPI003638EABA
MDRQRRPVARNPHSGPGDSRPLKSAQQINSTEPPDRTRVTRDHEVIRRWAEQRGARPATTPFSETNGRLGNLRFDFPGYGGAILQPVEWERWFDTFDARHFRFLYQERRPDGSRSNFNRLELPRDEL